MRFYLETYGCAANRGNSEAFASALVDAGTDGRPRRRHSS